MVPKADSGTFLLLFLLVLSIIEPLRPGRGGGGAGGAGRGRVSPGWPRTARTGGGMAPSRPLRQLRASLPLCAVTQSRDAAEHRSPVPAACIRESLDLPWESG